MARLPRHIFRRGKSYYLRVSLAGKEYRRSLGADLQEARHRSLLILNELRGSCRNVEQPTTTGDDVTLSVERWLTEVVPHTRNSRATRNAEGRLRRYFLPMLSGTLQDIRTNHLRAVRNYAESEGLAASTVAGVMSDVRCFLNWCVSEGLIDRTPWRKGLVPRLQERGPDRLSDAEVTMILDALPEGHGLLVRLSLLTGIRRGELVALQWRHVLLRPRPSLLIEGTKSGKVRRVPLVPEAVGVIQALRATTSSVFVSWHRNPNAQAVTRLSGLPWHWHQLRHTFACRYLEAGGRLSALQRILGHATSRMTERYAALSDDAVFDDADRIADEFSNSRPGVAQKTAQAGAENLEH